MSPLPKVFLKKELVFNFMTMICLALYLPPPTTKIKKEDWLGCITWAGPKDSCKNSFKLGFMHDWNWTEVHLFDIYRSIKTIFLGLEMSIFCFS